MIKQTKLDLTTFNTVVSRLSIALDEYQKDNSNEFVRDACIQRFKYCYDLADKFIARYLATLTANIESIQKMSFQARIRQAFTLGVVKNSWDKWREYRENRSTASHSYNKTTALAVMQSLPVFYQELLFLQQTLTDKNGR